MSARDGERAGARRDQEIEDRARVQGYGSLAGWLLIGGTVLSIPGRLLSDPPPETYLLTALVAFTGLVCLSMPWQRISPRWLHAVGVVATLEVGAAVAFVEQTYGFYFVVIAILVAHATRSRPAVLGHLALIVAVVLAPIAWEPESARSIVSRALLLIPSVAVATGMVVYLRERLEVKQRMYRSFAEEVLELTGKIRGTPIGRPGPKSGSGTGPVPREARQARVWAPARLRMASLGASVLLGVPLAFASLAVAGAALPGFAVRSFDRVGIELPHQSTGESVGGGTEAVKADAAPRAGGGRAPQHRAAVKGGAPAELALPRNAGGAGDAVGTDAAVDVAAPATPTTEAPAGLPATSPAPPVEGGGAASPAGPLQHTLDRALRDTGQHLDEVVSGLGLRLP